MMKKIGEISDWLKSEYSELNKSNFSVAIDVIVIRQKDGSLKGTPFFVRFGKLSVLKPKNVMAHIKINDSLKSLRMRLNENGEAFFIDDSKEHENISTNENDIKSSCSSSRDEVHSKPVTHSTSCPIIKTVKTVKNLLIESENSSKCNKNCDTTLFNTEEKPTFFLTNNSDTASICSSNCDEKFFENRTLPHEQLVKLNLEKGINEVKYCVITAKGEEKFVTGYIFLWNHYEKIVVSDIDGTITRTALRGQILSIIGHDWYHDHIGELLTSIAENGYKIIYLSARPFFQCDITRNVLKSIKQEEKTLPLGPLIVNPVGFVDAFHREIIDKTPDEFKIKFLKDLMFFFPENPFYAGFGDKITDVNTYSSIGIDSSLIFVVDELGQVNYSLNQKDPLTYKKLVDNINKLFPVTFIM